jgi:hypothetical protein
MDVAAKNLTQEGDSNKTRESEAFMNLKLCYAFFLLLPIASLLLSQSAMGKTNLVKWKLGGDKNLALVKTKDIVMLKSHAGDVLRTKDIIKRNVKKSLNKLLSQASLENKNGEIFYPEEFDFAIIKAPAFGPQAKAPHE